MFDRHNYNKKMFDGDNYNKFFIEILKYYNNPANCDVNNNIVMFLRLISYHIDLQYSNTL